MSEHTHLHGHGGRPSSLKTALVVTAFLAIAGFFLLSEHRAHLFGILPFLLVFSCPLLHLFMHRGHGHGHDGARTRHTDAGKVEPHEL